ncbi:MAG: hypothetical protein JNM80_05275 [Phycisphaerae bacterium]|nr:hypothetical protein [Phycisphaerae bacterium]
MQGMTRAGRVAGIAGAAVGLLAPTASGQGVSASQDRALTALREVAPGVRVGMAQGRVLQLYGAPMGWGGNAYASAGDWLRDHGAALAADGSEFVLAWHATFEDGKFTVFCFQQSIAGVPVEHGIVKVLVPNLPGSPVVYAAGTVARAPAGGFARAEIDGATAVALVRATDAPPALTEWERPTLVVYQGTGDWREPALAWKVTGESPKLEDALRRTYFVSAATGEVLGERNEVAHTAVGGTASGMGSPGLRPDISVNPPAMLAMPEIRVGIVSGTNGFADRAGAFTLANPGTIPVTVQSGVGTASGFGGRWVNVVPTGASGITASASNVTPPGPASLVFNPTPTALLTAQVNAFVHTTLAHNYFRDRSGTYNNIDVVLRANTGVSGSCNAYWNGSSINFFNAGNGCPNTAYSTVVAHEYGHFIVDNLGGGAGLPQNAFGEGFSDTIAMLLYDTPVVGHDFLAVGQNLREPLAANKQYPCTSAIHTCGMVLGGVWYRIRQNFGTFYGSANGLTRARQLHVSWALITTGGPDAANSAGPSTAVEVLTINDDDGNLANGTPDQSRICAAFAAHGIACGGTGGGGPPNDTCATASAITNGSTPFDTRNAATNGLPECGQGDAQIYKDLWYVYTAPCSGTATIDTCDSDFDTKIAVYGSACPTAVGAAIACNDDSCGTRSRLSWPVVAGQPYRIRVGGYSNQSGTGSIRLSCAPGSNACASRAPITNGTTAFSTIGATTDGPMESLCGFGFGDLQVNQDIWFSYTASCTGLATVDLCGSTFDTKVAVYLGGCPTTSSTAIACNDDACGPVGAAWQSRVTWASRAGQNYTLRVGGFRSASGTGSITLGCVPCYANCDGSTTVPVLNMNDFVCFMNEYATNGTYANCDGSTTPPVLNIFDFVCFRDRFAAGCQ